MNSYLLFCDNCKFKTIISSNEELKKFLIFKSAPIPGGAPILDTATKEIKIKPSIPQTKKIKCPKCGLLIRPKKQEDKDDSGQTNNIDGRQTGLTR
jgi:hypothetical protein